jgi:hypothetical protein
MSNGTGDTQIFGVNIPSVSEDVSTYEGAFTTPGPTGVPGTGIGSWLYDLFSAPTSSLWTAVTGTVSPAAKASGVAGTASGLQQAGLSASNAQAQAQQIWDSQLQAAGADPSQAGLPEWMASFQTILTVALIAGLLYFVIMIFVLKKRPI